MKTYKIVLLFFAVLFVAVSCMKEEEQPDYEFRLGIMNIVGDSVIITTDENERLWVNNKSILATLTNGTRIYIQYTVVETAKPAGISAVIQIADYEKVFVKPVIVLTPEIADSIGNDEMSVENIWLAKNFLNVNIGFYYGMYVHRINLTCEPGEIPIDTVQLEIRHNDLNDPGTQPTIGFVSFDLVSLKNDVRDSVVVHVKAKEFNNRTFSQYFTYKY